MDTSIKDKKIGLVGLGHVGLTLGLTFAEEGFAVYGVDVNPTVKEKLRNGTAHFSERGLDELLNKHIGSSFKVVDSFEGGNECDIYIVTVGTPLTKDIQPDYGAIRSAAEDLGRCIRPGNLVILRSTVPLGTTRDVVWPLMQQISGLPADDILVAFAPERTIEGNALEELRTLPQIVGGANEKSTEAAAALFRTITDTIVTLPTLEEAEIVKLINNAYRETVFSFANEVALVSAKWGIDTKRVIKAANEGYARSAIPMPSPGVGGYCLTKDGFLLSKSAQAKGLELRIIPQTRHSSSDMLHHVANSVNDFLKKHRPLPHTPRIAILGFAFKGHPQTSDMRGSMTTTLVKRLATLPRRFELVGYDPLVPAERIEELGVHAESSMASAVAGADAIVIMNNHPAFRELAIEELPDGSKGPVMLFDTWGLIEKEGLTAAPHIIHHTL